MILLAAKPFFSPFQIWVFAFIGSGIILWLSINVVNGVKARRERRNRHVNGRMKIVEPMDSIMSSDGNETFKN